MEEERNGRSLGDILHMILSQKWLALAVAAVVALVVTIALYYGYNPTKKEYSVKFSLNLPGDNNGNVYEYPDGGKFYYTDLVLSETLETVKAADGSFSGIDVADMAACGGIKIVRERVTEGTDNKVVETSYILSVSSGYFTDAGQAKNFLMAVTNYPANYLLKMNLNYDAYLGLAARAEDYDTEIKYLEEQLDYVLKGYNTLISSYGESFVVPPKDTSAQGRTLNDYLLSIREYKDRGVLERLVAEARNETSPYIKSLELKESKYRFDLERVKREYLNANNTLQTLLNAKGDGGGTVMLDAAVIKQQSDLVQSLDEQVQYIQNYIDKGTVSKEFDDKVKAAHAEVKELADLYSRVFERVYSLSTSVKYANAGVITENGGYSFVLIAVLGVILGVAVAGLVAYIVAYSLEKKAEKVKVAAETAAVGAEPEPADAAKAEEVQELKEDEEKR